MKVTMQAVIIIVLLFTVSVLFGKLTGQYTTRTDSSGALLGQHLNYHPEREITTIEISSDEFNKDGVPIIKRGESFEAVIKPWKGGVFTGYQIENAVSGLKFTGNHCLRGGDGDFCSNSYKCVDEDPNNCKIVGSKCYGDKLINIRVPEDQKVGRYAVTVCEDRNNECFVCDPELREEFIIE